MAAISGVTTNAGLKIASTFGTAVQAAAGNKLKAEITLNGNVEVLRPRQIGSGASAIQTAARGNLKPVVNLKLDGGYRNCMDYIIAQMFGTAGAPAEQTAGQGDYKHTITFNTSINAKYITIAWEDSSATTTEIPSCATRSISFNVNDAPGILDFGAELIGNDIVLSTAVNTNANLASATATDTETINYAFDDIFRYNANSAGALGAGNNTSILGYSLTLTRPQEMKGELRAATGNAAPLQTDLFSGSLQVTLSNQADHTWWTIWSGETPQKCSLNIQGTQIGTGVNKAITIYLPKIQLVQEPQYTLTSAGVNALVLNFEILQATANPTGMSSTLPYFEIINALSTSLLA